MSTNNLQNCKEKTSTLNQQALLTLSALKAHGALSTIELRDNHGILYPPARIFELRRAGFLIDTITVQEPDSHGRSHRVARYLFRGFDEQEGAI